MKTPLDHPTPARPHRVYAALTNHCNRACPWCSTCSSPAGGTFLAPDDLERALPAEGPFEVQLEGGEPTVHPRFWDIVQRARLHPRCTRLVLCTNGVVLPRRPERLAAWLARLGDPLTLKLSFDHHLLDHDPGLVALAVDTRRALAALGGDRLFVLNVRLRRGVDDDDRRVTEAARAAGLLDDANVFHLQRYGFAEGEASWDEPFLVGHHVRFVNPDGRVMGPDLVARFGRHAGAAVTAHVEAWRREKSAAFDLRGNSTAGRTVRVDFDGEARDVYANANLSVYSAQTCNARCAFCVEELRPASRGRELAAQRAVEADDGRWFAALERVLDVVERELRPSVSVTGGEPSKDPRLPRVLRTLAARGARKRTVTTNGSGLLDVREGRRVVDWIAETGVRHLNVSRAHPDQQHNARLMRYAEGPTEADMRAIVAAARAGGTRVRLSCVLVEGAIASLEDLVRYVDFARSVGVDNVIFRQLMKTDPRTVTPNFVVRFSDRKRVALEPLLDRVSADARFSFVRQIVGYYYYVEVWRMGGVDVVFEEADLARLEDVKRADPGVVHELVFHPDGKLASTWQPWDGVLLG